MKSYFVFVRNMSQFDRDSVVYDVTVGASDRDQVMFALVQEFVRDCGIFFKRRDLTTSTTIANLAKSLFPGSALPSLHLRRAKVSIAQLYNLIIESGFDAYESKLKQPQGTFRLLCSLDYKTISPTLPCNTKRTAIPSSRKNLKSEGRQDALQACIGFGLILIAFLCAAYICGTEVYV